MISREQLIDYLNNYLQCSRFNDNTVNGLQVEGQPTVKRICTAVTASLEAIEACAKLKADTLLVHHGFFWKGEPQIITGIKKARMAVLLNNNINLLAYHLPLDCHLEIGNNIGIAQQLNLQNISWHSAGGTPGLLGLGELPNSVTVDALSKQLALVFNRLPLTIDGGINSIKKLAWCSGGAQDFINLAKDLGADAYISGEISERTYYQAKELPIHYFACGHHATERFGIQALGEHLANKYDLEVQFLDSNNPI